MIERCRDCIYYCHELGFCYTGRGNHPIYCAYYVKERPKDSITVSTSYGDMVLFVDDPTDRQSYRVCISCGTPLKPILRGRRKLCANCGVYLPKIIYDISA